MLLVILICLVYILWVCLKSDRRNIEPPLAPGCKFVIGHALSFVGGSEYLWEQLSFLTNEARKHDGAIKALVGLQTLYLVADPIDFTIILNSCLKRLQVNDFVKPWLGNGLVTADPLTWTIHRRLINPSFGQQVVDSFLDIFNSQSRRFVKSLEVEVGKAPFDHYVYCHRNTLETICLTALGDDFMKNSDKTEEYLQAIDKMFNILISRFQRFWLHNDLIYNFSSYKRKEKQYIKILHKASSEILEKKKEKYVNNLKGTEKRVKGTKYKPFMELLLELSQSTKVLTDREIKEHVDTIIVSGSDTTGGAVTFCMLLVGSHPRVQDKIIEELEGVFGKEDRDVTKEDLSKLVYLEAVIKESLRLYPSVPIIGRDIDVDVKLCNYTLLKGSSAYLSIYAIYHHPLWGPDVEEFKPERWLDHSSLPPWANSIGFGVGRRFCIGKSYALMSLKTTMAHVCRRYIIHGDHRKMKLKLDVLLKPSYGHNITIENRI